MKSCISFSAGTSEVHNHGIIPSIEFRKGVKGGKMSHSTALTVSLPWEGNEGWDRAWNRGITEREGYIRGMGTAEGGEDERDGNDRGEHGREGNMRGRGSGRV